MISILTPRNSSMMFGLKATTLSRSANRIVRRSYIFIKPVIIADRSDDPDSIPVSLDLPRAVLTNGEFKCPWSTDTKKDMNDVFQMLYEKYKPKPPFLGIHNTSSMIKGKQIDMSKIMNNEHNVTWLGHSTCLFRIGNVGIITDPVWNDVVGPPIITKFVGPRRVVDPLTSVSSLLPLLDIVLISHSHYDHLDIETAEIIGNSKLWIVPLGVKDILSTVGVTNCIELDWWNSHILEIGTKRIEITLTPAKHWSARSFHDRNTSLWGSFVIASNTAKYFFTGDTAYCPVFKQIGEKFGPFDFSAIPIGAYKPRWFMKDVHCDPSEAIKIHKDIRSKKSFAIHWGTYPLAEEDFIEPALELGKERQKNSIHPTDFFTMAHGDTYLISDKDGLDGDSVAIGSDFATVLQPDLFQQFLKLDV